MKGIVKHHQDTLLQDLGGGTARRVLSFNEQLMAVEVSFETGAEGAVLEENMEVTIMPLSGNPGAEPVRGSILSVADHPLSYAEASMGIEGDYVLASLGISTWNIVVEVAAEESLYEDVIYTVTAVTDTQRPIDMIFQ